MAAPAGFSILAEPAGVVLQQSHGPLVDWRAINRHGLRAGARIAETRRFRKAGFLTPRLGAGDRSATLPAAVLSTSLQDWSLQYDCVARLAAKPQAVVRDEMGEPK
jgi:hypothetical protein